MSYHKLLVLRMTPQLSMHVRTTAQMLLPLTDDLMVLPQLITFALPPTVSISRHVSKTLDRYYIGLYLPGTKQRV